MVARTWQILDQADPPLWLMELAGGYVAEMIAKETKASPLPAKPAYFAGKLLWQRGWRTAEQVKTFLDPYSYSPSSPNEFGQEMTWAIARLLQAYTKQERVVIWGDFDADGITSTAVLWEGMKPFFQHLRRFIPDRLKDNHGLCQRGIDLIKADCDLIVTCDTGSTSLAEIDYLNSLGIDVIITDHHTLPPHRPPVVAIINPRYLPQDHPLFHLSGVGVAYKLMEALYQAIANDPSSVENLLDLVAIGLVADLVELRGDCRYLAQRGITLLRQRQRMGLKLLLEKCQQAGDRPIDISFGIAPRLNSVSRIWGDVDKCVDLLTSDDKETCAQLVSMAEIANSKRKELQKQVYEQVKARISQLDLSTTGVVVVADPEWSVGILGLVAASAVRDFCRPVIVCNISEGIVRGSARSYGNIDLYELIRGQEHLLLSMGGHPYAGGLSLLAENLEIFTAAINQKFWSQYGHLDLQPCPIADLVAQVADLNKALFQELKLLEPYGMGNPSPKIMVQQAQFTQKRRADIMDGNKQKVKFTKTEFVLKDNTGAIAGVWWGHEPHELPEQLCDVLVEFGYDYYKNRYEVRLEEFRLSAGAPVISAPEAEQVKTVSFANTNYTPTPKSIDPPATWQTLLGVAKYLHRTGQATTLGKLQDRLEIWHTPILLLGLQALKGIAIEQDRVFCSSSRLAVDATRQKQFISALQELNFRCQHSSG